MPKVHFALHKPVRRDELSLQVTVCTLSKETLDTPRVLGGDGATKQRFSTEQALAVGL